MNQPACVRSPRLFGCCVAVLGLAIMPNGAAAEAPLLPDLPPQAPVAPAPPPAEVLKPIDAEVGIRLGARAQNPGEPDKLNDLAMDGRVDVQLAGSINSALKWQAGFIGTFGLEDQGRPNGTSRSELEGKAAVLDLIGRLELHEAFNLWVGRMLVAADRAGLSTEWSIAPWLLPGQFTSALRPVGPRHGRFGRSDGATLWGDLVTGVLKYYVGVTNLGDPDLAPLYSGRLSLSLLSPEPGYRVASTYYGSKDVLTIGLGFQYQVDGSTHALRTTSTDEVDAWDDFTEVNLDLLFEKNLGSAGVLDVEGAFYKMWGQYEPETWTAFALVSTLLPIEVGWGHFQPLFRLQRASQRDGGGSDTLADAQLGYIIDGARARVIAGYRYSKVSDQRGNALLFGLQLLTR